MLRESAERVGDWREKTMSALCARRETACQRRLLRGSERGLFSEDNAIPSGELLKASYDAQETGRAILFEDTEALRARVLSRLPQEAALLSAGERGLLTRALQCGGEAQLMDSKDFKAAESLRARFWATSAARGERLYLRLAEPLCTPISSALFGGVAEALTEPLDEFANMVNGLLYFSGFLDAEAPIKFFGARLFAGENGSQLGLRFLRATFESVLLGHGAQSGLLLVHPALAEPERLVRAACSAGMGDTRLTGDVFQGCMCGMLPEETPSSRMLSGALSGALRSGRDADELTRDLRMMAKQGASLDAMRAVMKSVLIQLPTRTMENALELLFLHTVRWSGVVSPVVN